MLQKLTESDANHILIHSYTHLEHLKNILIQLYRNTEKKGPENPLFYPAKWTKMPYFVNNGPENPQKWYKPYINAFLRTIRAFWKNSHTIMSKYWEERVWKHAFLSRKMDQNGIFRQ